MEKVLGERERDAKEKDRLQQVIASLKQTSAAALSPSATLNLAHFAGTAGHPNLYSVVERPQTITLPLTVNPLTVAGISNPQLGLHTAFRNCTGCGRTFTYDSTKFAATHPCPFCSYLNLG